MYNYRVIGGFRVSTHYYLSFVPMITFQVGEHEKHEVTFSYETTWGKVQIFVDGKIYTTSRVMMIGHTPFTLQVGDKEKHTVRIELDNPMFFAYRGSSVRAFVDEKLVLEDHVKGSDVLLIFTVVIILVFFAIPMLSGLSTVVYILLQAALK